MLDWRYNIQMEPLLTVRTIMSPKRVVHDPRHRGFPTGSTRGHECGQPDIGDRFRDLLWTYKRNEHSDIVFKSSSPVCNVFRNDRQFLILN